MAGILNVNNLPNLSDKKLTSKLSFEVGQTFSAKVVSSDESKNVLTLRLPDGWQFPATLEKPAEFTGQGLVKFQVVGFENGVIQLNLVETKESGNQKEENSIENALLDQNLALDKEEFELLINMLKHNMPLTKENIVNVKIMMNLKNEIAGNSQEKESFIQKYLNSKDIQLDSPEANEIKQILNEFLDTLSSASEEDILTLMENGIDITSDNIKSFNNIVKGQEVIYKDLDVLKNEIVKEYNFESSSSSGLVKNDDIVKLLEKIQKVDVDKVLDKSDQEIKQTIKEDIKQSIDDFFDKVEGKGKYDNKEEQKFISFLGMEEEEGAAEDKGLMALTEQVIKQRVTNSVSTPIVKMLAINLAILKDNIKSQQMNENTLENTVLNTKTSILNDTNSILQNGLEKLIDESMGKMINDMLMEGVSSRNSTITNLQEKRGSIESLVTKLQEDISTSIKNTIDKVFNETKGKILNAQEQNQSSNEMINRAESEMADKTSNQVANEIGAALRDTFPPAEKTEIQSIISNIDEKTENNTPGKEDIQNQLRDGEQAEVKTDGKINIIASKDSSSGVKESLPEKIENLKQFAQEVLQKINKSYDEAKAPFKQEATKVINDLFKNKLEIIQNETKDVPIQKELEDFGKNIKTELQDILVKQTGKEISSFKLTKIIDDVLKDKLSSLNDAKNNNFAEIKEQILTRTEEMKNAIRDFLGQKLELKPEMYSKILDTIKSNINDFKVYNSLSNQYYLLDLPINYRDREYECKLIIKDDRKNGKKIDSQNVKFVVTVNTTNIGTVDAFLDVKKYNLNISIKCDGQWIKLLNQRKDKLLKDIMDMGYSVNIEFMQRKEPVDLVSARSFFDDKTISAIDTRV